MSTTDQLLEIRLLGGFSVTVAGREVPGFHQPRLQLLLAYLLLHRHAPRLRQELAFCFWPDSSEAQARTNLRKLLHMLRAILPEADRRLSMTAQTIHWRLDAPDRLDVAGFENALAAAAGATPDEAAGHWQAAVQAYQGDLLPGHYDEWLLSIREHYAAQAANALAQLVEHYLQTGAPDNALRYARSLVAHDPLREESHRLLIELHLRQDDRAAALRAYHTCSTLLRDELGVDPSPATEALYHAALQTETLPQTAPPRTVVRTASALPFVGRREAQQQLYAIWQRVATGGAHFAVIQGEPGLGKTRLAAEIAALVQHQGAATAYTRAYAAAGAGAYAPVIDLLRTPEVRRRVSGLAPVWRSELLRLLPELRDEQPDLPSPPPMTESWQQRRLHEAVARACVGDGKPLLIHLDDLQWCDHETLAWLRFLLSFAATSSLLLVGTLRDNEVDADHPIHALRQGLMAEGRGLTLSLAPFTRAETAALAQAAVGHELDDSGIDRINASSEGNPLFIVEMARSGFVDGQVRQDLPPRVHAVIMQRLAQLSPAARGLANLAAVMGRHFTYPVLHAAQVGEDDLLAGLDELWRRRIIREQGLDAYDFSHDRIREVTYGALSPVARRRLHAHIADVMTDHFRAELDGVSSQIAAHYEAAGRRDDAAAFYRRAAAHAAASFANDEAVYLYHRAMDCLPPHDWATRFELLVACDRIHDLDAETPHRLANLHQMDALLNTLPPTAAAQQRAQYAVCHSQYLRVTGRNFDARASGDTALRYARQAGDAGLEIDAYTVRGYAEWGMGRMAQARATLEHAVDLAHAIGDDEREAKARELTAQSGMFSGMSREEILDHLHRCIAIHRRHNHLYGQASIHNKLGYLVMAQGEGDYGQAIRDLEISRDIANHIGATHVERNTICNLGYVYMLCGDYGQAEDWLLRALESARVHNDAHRIAAAGRMAGTFYRQIGDYAAAETLLIESIARCQKIGARHWRLMAQIELGVLYLAQQCAEEARTALEEALQDARSQRDTRYEADAQVNLGHLYLKLENYAAARAAYAAGYALRQRMQQYKRALEAQIGLVEAAYHCGDLAVARAEWNVVAERALTEVLERTDEVLGVYVRAAHLASHFGDGRANGLEAQARQQLQHRAATLTGDDRRRTFWAAPAHAPFAP